LPWRRWCTGWAAPGYHQEPGKPLTSRSVPRLVPARPAARRIAPQHLMPCTGHLAVCCDSRGTVAPRPVDGTRLGPRSCPLSTAAGITIGPAAAPVRQV
jgi:hypothetical protein